MSALLLVYVICVVSLLQKEYAEINHSRVTLRQGFVELNVIRTTTPKLNVTVTTSHKFTHALVIHIF